MYYRAYSSHQAKICINGSWVALGVPRVTTLPSNPADGDEVYYVVTNPIDSQEVLWHMRYNSSTNYWDYISGPPIYQQGPGGNESCNPSSTCPVGTWINLATSGPMVTAPRPGEYMVNFGAAIFNTVGGTGSSTGVSVNNGNPASGLSFRMDAAGAAIVSTGSIKKRVSISSAGNTLRLKYQSVTAGNYNINWSNRWIEVTPVRLQ